MIPLSVVVDVVGGMCAPLDGRPGGLFPLGRRKQMSVSVDGSRVWIPAHIHFTTPCSKCQYVVQQFKHFSAWVIYERAFCIPGPYPTAEGSPDHSPRPSADNSGDH